MTAALGDPGERPCTTLSARGHGEAMPGFLTHRNYNIINVVLITSHLSEWLSSINQRTTVLGRTWRKGNPHVLLVGLQIGAATMENGIEAPQKI